MPTAQILDGKATALHYRKSLKEVIAQLRHTPKLCVILVGNDPASTIYVQQKHKACEEVGIASENIQLDASISESILMNTIDQLNQTPEVTGILVQLPLPDHIDTARVLRQIEPHKDVDCFHPINVGLLAQRMPDLRPATPMGMIRLLEHYRLQIKSKHAVVVGASNIVGRPMALELLIAGATVTICHRFTENLDHFVAQADILIAAAGRPHLIPGGWIKPGAVVLDVGVHRTSHGLCGDVDFESAKQRAGWISPVPGGVGPMTVTCLLENTVRAYHLQDRNHAH